MIRVLLRNWLGITTLEARVVLPQNTVDGLATMNRQVLAAHAEANALLTEVRQLREMVSDPKRIPIKTRNGTQFRALMEQET